MPQKLHNTSTNSIGPGSDDTSGCGDVTSGYADLTSGFADITSGFSDVTSGFSDLTSGCGDLTSGFGGLVQAGVGELPDAFRELVPGGQRHHLHPESGRLRSLYAQ